MSRRGGHGEHGQQQAGDDQAHGPHGNRIPWAAKLPSGWLGDDTRLAFSLLTRQQYDARIDLRVTGREPGSQDGFELLYDQRLTETWGGLTLSRRISERVGIGATLYGVNRRQRTRWEQNLQLANHQGRPLAALVVDDFNYTDWALLGKLGLAWEGNPLRLRLAVTTPRASLYAFGSEERDLGQLGLLPGIPSIVEGRRIVTKSSRFVLTIGYLFGKS